MLWRFNFAQTSTLDSLLSREIPPTVEEVMDEQDVLNECKAQNNKLIQYLSRGESVKGLLQWVVAGLDELDQEAALADSTFFDSLPTSSPLYQIPLSPVIGSTSIPDIPGPGPDSPPLEPAKMGDDIPTLTGTSPTEHTGAGYQGSNIGLGEGLERQQSRESEAVRSRYPQVATEILTSELWVIAETAVTHSDALLKPFWDAVIPPLAGATDSSTPSTASTYNDNLEKSERDRAREEFWSDQDEERDRKREIIRGLWARTNIAFIVRRPHEMLRFLKSMPNLVERIVLNISSPAVQDVLGRIVCAEEAGVSGVIDWLAEEGLVSRLISYLSPSSPPALHSIVSDLLKSIITACAPSPLNFNGGNPAMQQGGNPQAGNGNTQPLGTRDNRLIRELVSESSIRTMVGYMLDDVQASDRDWKGLNGDGTPHPGDPFVIHPLPSIASISSSLSHICNIFVELIRRNNSDFSEPHLFHSLRQRLMNIQMQNQAALHTSTSTEDSQAEYTSNEQREEEIRQEMERVLLELSPKMGIVHLGHLITVLCDRFEELNDQLVHPRSLGHPGIAPGKSNALTLDRFRVVELYAELLHSSNMSILNRKVGTGPNYSPDGILSGGLAGLELLGEAIEGDGKMDDDAVTNDGNDSGEITEDNVTKARELPISSASTECSMTGSSGEDVEEVASDDEDMLEHMDDEVTPSPSPAASGLLDRSQDVSSTPTSTSTLTAGASSEDKEGDAPRPNADDLSDPSPMPPPPSQADVKRLRDVMGIESTLTPSTTSVLSGVSGSNAAVAATTVAPSVSSERNDDVEGYNGEESNVNAATSIKTTTMSEKAKEAEVLPPGHRLKKMYIDHNVLPTVVDLFFDFTNNDFMHHVVYDLLQQILNGKLVGTNRDLVVELINGARLVEKILHAQRVNDEMIRQPKTPRLAYMGHISLIAEELVKLLSRCPPDLYAQIQDSYNHSEWEAFVEGSLRETKARDTQPLAGGKPMSLMTVLHTGDGGQSSKESEDSSSDSDDDGGDGFGQKAEMGGGFGEPLTRTHAQDGFVPRGGNGEYDGFDDNDDNNYWGANRAARRHVDSSDDDDDDADWLRPSASNAHGRGSDDDEFGVFHNSIPARALSDDFDDDDGWGNFTSSNSDDADNPFGDDNFAPSVTPANRYTQRAPQPLTPHDWASEFDREFADDAESPAIVVPNLDDDDDDDESTEGEERSGLARALEGEGTPNSGTSPNNGWIFTGDDDGEDLPPTISPTLEDTPRMAPAPMLAKPISTPAHSATVPPPQSTPFSTPLPIQPISTSPSGQRPSLLSQQFASPASPRLSQATKALSIQQVPGRSPPSSGSSNSASSLSRSPASPVTIPRDRRKSFGSGDFANSPSSPITIPQRNSLSDLSGISGAPLSPVASPSSAALMHASSPPEASLMNVPTQEEPLGPGVSADTHVTIDGMLEKEVDGKRIVVPQDEIIRGVEEAHERRSSS